MKENIEFIKIVRANIQNEKYMITSQIDLENLYSLACRHNMSNYLYDSTLENKYPKDLAEKIKQDYQKQIVRDTNYGIEINNILKLFEKNNIKSLVLKGIVIKELYNKPYMRKMADIDILVEQQSMNKVKKIMENLNYKLECQGYVHDTYFKSPIFNVEIHQRLMPEYNEYFDNILNKSILYLDYKNIYQMGNEDLYVYYIWHLAKHFKGGGIGVRDILDIYFLNEKYKDIFNKNKIDNLLKDLELDRFEYTLKKISYKWFDGENDINSEDVEQYILDSGSYGTEKHVVQNKIMANNGNKVRYVISLFFPSLDVMKKIYPILNKFPILLPFTWILKLVKCLRHPINKINRLIKVKNAKSNDLENTSYIFDKLGLK